MSKLLSIIPLAMTAALLAGCASAADEPEAQPAATSESASPSVSPTVEETTPEPTEAPSEEAPEPSPEATTEAAPVPEQPEEPVPTIDPLPVGPNDPFVPPPHGEPNPLIPATPHVDSDYFKKVTVEPVSPDHPAYGQHTAVVQQGATLTVVGSGYAAGQEIHVVLGWPNTDYNYITQPTGFADQNGAFSFPIVIGTNVPPHDYVVMTVPLVADPDVRETLKRYTNVTIITAI